MRTLIVMFVLFSSVTSAQSAAREQSGTLVKQLTETVRMPYLVVLPKGFNLNKQRWPVILYLHGAGDRGNDLALVRRTAAVRQAESRQDYPFLLIAPQEPDTDQSWLYPANVAAVMNILNDAIAKYNGDPDRVYLTGISMGGWGSWFYAQKFPGTFAAIAPLCGFPDTKWAPKLVHTPIWTFHGTNDTVAPLIDTERMVEALQKLGGDPKFTPVTGGDHDIAQAVYSRGDLYAWFLQHRRNPPHAQAETKSPP